MNSVSPASAACRLTAGREAERGVVLLCSLLFLLYLSLSYFTGTHPSSVSSLQLAQTSPRQLGLVSVAVADQGQLLTAVNSHLAPFFFKPIAINFCDKMMLMSVRGIGPSLAGKILYSRKEQGPFRSSADLMRVPGIGNQRRLQFTPSFDFSHER